MAAGGAVVMGLLETARSFLLGGRGCIRRPRREVDDKADRRDVEISKAEERLERLLTAEDDLFRQGRGK
jgi:hypothetical protein